MFCVTSESRRMYFGISGAITARTAALIRVSSAVETGRPSVSINLRTS